MNKSQLVEAVAKDSGFSKADVGRARITQRQKHALNPTTRK